jgi:hypothetical protein
LTLESFQISKFLCPFAVYYLRYAVRSFFTLFRISLADGMSGTKNRRSGTKSKIPCTFYPALLKSAKQIVNNHSFCFSHQTDQGEETEGLEREVLERER